MSVALAGIGLATSVAGNIIGGIKSAQIAQEQQANLNREKQFSENLFNREYYQDVLSRTENQSMLREINDNQRESEKRAKSTAAITGATPEENVARGKANASVYASAVNRMAGIASQRKDQALNHYSQRRMGFLQAQNGVDEGRKAAWGTFMGNALNLGNAAMSMTADTLADPNPGIQKDAVSDMLNKPKAIPIPKVGVPTTKVTIR